MVCMFYCWTSMLLLFWHLFTCIWFFFLRKALMSSLSARICLLPTPNSWCTISVTRIFYFYFYVLISYNIDKWLILPTYRYSPHTVKIVLVCAECAASRSPRQEFFCLCWMHYRAYILTRVLVQNDKPLFIIC